MTVITPAERMNQIGEPDFDAPGHVVAVEVIADIARARDIVVLSDEIYSRLLYTGKHESIATLDGMLDRAILPANDSTSGRGSNDTRFQRRPRDSDVRHG